MLPLRQQAHPDFLHEHLNIQKLQTTADAQRAETNIVSNRRVANYVSYGSNLDSRVPETNSTNATRGGQKSGLIYEDTSML